MSGSEVADGRRRRGERTRNAIAAAAAARASVDGLANLTIGGIAAAVGTAKSSVQAAFPSKELLQLAAFDAASGTFVQEVVVPAAARPEGLDRLWALVDYWLDYVERRVFPGGCFITANLAEVDSRPGAVHDRFAAARDAWLGLLAEEVRVAQAAGTVARRPAARLVAFEIDALLMAANIDRNLTDAVTPLREVRSLIALRLGVPAPRRRSRAGPRG